MTTGSESCRITTGAMLPACIGTKLQFRRRTSRRRLQAILTDLDRAVRGRRSALTAGRDGNIELSTAREIYGEHYKLKRRTMDHTQKHRNTHTEREREGQRGRDAETGERKQENSPRIDESESNAPDCRLY